MAGGRFRELLKKYGKVAMGVHFTVSAASITGLYVAVKNNVDVEAMLQKIGMPTGLAKKEDEKVEMTNIPLPESVLNEEFVINDGQPQVQVQTGMETRNRTSELAATAGGALTLAILLNKALFPIRVPITVALTPPIARFLARRNIIKNSGLVN